MPVSRYMHNTPKWWQQKQFWALIVVALAIVIVLIIIGYSLDWTGFNSYVGPQLKSNQQYRPEKTLWDWLQLLIIPVVLAVAALLFNLAITRTEQKIALDRQREDLLQKYLDCMSELLLKEGLRSSAVDAEVRNFARVRTITLLFQLDARRIGLVFGFLRETKLMSNKPDGSIVSLSGADLRKINLSQANLSGADLSEANLSGADLKGANFTKAELSGADLSGAVLIGANVTEKQLRSAKSLKGATMPDGSEHP